MNKFDSAFKPGNSLLVALLAAALVAGCGDGIFSNDDNVAAGGGGTGPGPAGASPSLGAAAPYGVFASADAAVTLAVDALIVGDVGLMDGLGTCGNCTGVTVTGAIENGTVAAGQAQSAFQAAYVDAANRATNACAIVDGELSSAQANCDGVTSGPVYVPGLYRTASPIGIGDNLSITLDARGNPDAVFIFQTDAAITTGTSSTVTLAGGAQAKNVWWMAGSAATLGVSSDFKGTVIANGAGVSVLGGTALDRTLVEGRMFSSAAAVTVGQFATVTVPQ